MSVVHTLGVSAHFHDSAAALLADGRLVAAAQEERFTRRKGEARFPVAAITACLRRAGIGPGEVDHVAYYEKPLVKLDRLLTTQAQQSPQGWELSRRALPGWSGQRLEVAAAVRDHLGPAFAGEVAFADHHESHAASAFFPSPFERAATLVMDAVGEWTTSSIGSASGARVELLRELRYPHSLGLLYSAVTHYAGFAVNAGEYKLMGLAPYGEARYTDLLLDRLVELGTDGSLRLDLDYFDFHRGGAITSPAFHALFGGPPRRADEPLGPRQADLAASVQQVCELAVLRAARHARELTGRPHLVLAGGVALNSVANGRLAREGPFEAVWVQPAAGDAGGALGAALLHWHHVLDRPRRPETPDGQRGSLLGPAFRDDDVGLFLDGMGAAYERPGDEDELLERVVAWLDDGRVVGWFHGPMEFGPRALGARSILADARPADMQRAINAKIKFRESFRPFAPSVLREHVHEVFDTPDTDQPYMLFVAPLRAERRRAPTAQEAWRWDHPDPHVRVAAIRSDVPAVTHVDHTARLQTVDAERHGRYHRLLRRFHQRTGCPVLLNTSFNVRGEPIVQSPQDAYRCFLATDMDCLVLEDHLLRKADQPEHAHVAASATRDSGVGR